MVTVGETPRGQVTPWTQTKLYRKIRLYVIQRDLGRCHACSHFIGLPPKFNGAGIDHDPVPLTECRAKGIHPLDQRNLKAIHHSVPCAECIAAGAAKGNKWSGYCNALKGAGSLERFRLRLYEATGIAPGGPPAPGHAGGAGGGQGEREW